MRISSLIAESSSPFYSLEFFPPSRQEDWPEFFAMAESMKDIQPLFVSVTYGAGGSNQDKSLGVVSRLVRAGFNTLAHLTCVGADEAGILSFLERLRENGVCNVLAMRGDTPRGQKAAYSPRFRHADELVLFIRENMPEMGIGVAAYPAPHPESPTFSEDRLHTAGKFRAGAEFAITQLFFDTREYQNLVAGLHRHGIDVPVIPGILPIQSMDSLRRVLSMCGANIPGKLYLELEAAEKNGGHEALREAGLAFALRQIRELLDLGAPGIHLYTLNKSELCRRIAGEIPLP